MPKLMIIEKHEKIKKDYFKALRDLEKEYFKRKDLERNRDKLITFITYKIKLIDRDLNNPNTNWDEDTRGYLLNRRDAFKCILKEIERQERR